jgi:hypothetical protein
LRPWRASSTATARAQRDALVRRAKQHVEFNARGDDALCIELRQPAELGAIVKQAGVEKIGGKPAGLGLEFAKAQHAGIHRKLHEILRQSISACINHHGEFLVQVNQPQPQRHPLCRHQGR